MFDKLTKWIAQSRRAAREKLALRWLKRFDECGMRISEPFTPAQVLKDLDVYHCRVRPEIVLLLLGEQEEDEPFRDYSQQVYTFDVECIEEDGRYSEIIERMAAMTGGALKVANVTDTLDWPEDAGTGRVRISYECNGQLVEQEAEQEDDFVISPVLECLAALLNASGSTKRFFSTEGDGQIANVGCAELDCIRRLATLGMRAEVWTHSLPVPGVRVTPLGS